MGITSERFCLKVLKSSQNYLTWSKAIGTIIVSYRLSKARERFLFTDIKLINFAWALFFRVLLTKEVFRK